MRRKEKEITDQGEIEAIIRKAKICRLAMVDGDMPYVVPLCFGYRNGALYFHCAQAGRKLDILKKNNNVCVSFDVDTEIEESGAPCKWGCKYRSVTAFGKARLVDDEEAKSKALDIIMAQYSNGSFTYTAAALAKTQIIITEIERITGKKSV